MAFVHQQGESRIIIMFLTSFILAILGPGLLFALFITALSCERQIFDKLLLPSRKGS
ncbi:MAG: hypothetical protein H7837_03990 [Magnetococcus sp. MYC-9]